VLDQSISIGTAFGSDPVTIVRTRGNLWVQSDQTANSETPFGALGMIIVSDQAAGVGITAVPTPIAQAFNEDWFLYESFACDVAVATAVSTFAGKLRQYPFDSKAMRKAQNGDSVAIVLENGHATHGLQFLLKFRMLFMVS